MKNPRVCLSIVGLAFLFASCAADFSWEPCDRDKVKFIPSTVTLKPDPPIIGDNVDFGIQGQSDRGVMSGTLDILVFFADTQIYEETDDLCGKTSCPISPGVINIGITQPLPPIAPPGDYMVQVIARDEQQEELMCVNVNFTLVFPELSAANNAATGVDKAAALEQAKAAFAGLKNKLAKGKQEVQTSRRLMG